jgi:hypothetical protein
MKQLSSALLYSRLLGLTHKHKTRLERLARGNHSNVLQTFVKVSILTPMPGRDKHSSLFLQRANDKKKFFLTKTTSYKNLKILQYNIKANSTVSYFV